MTGVDQVSNSRARVVMDALRNLTLERAAAWLPVTAGFAALTGIGIARYTLWREPGFWAFVPVVDCALGVLLTAFALAAVLRIPRVRAALGSGPAVSWLLSLQVGIATSFAAVVLLVRHRPEEAITGWNFPLVNKQWLVALYNLSIVVVLVLPAAFERLRTFTLSLPRADAHPFPVSRRGRVRTLAGVLTIAVVCWYFAGPPWNLERHHRPIDWHEQLQLGPMQAIASGYLPYVGPASATYGPGVELLQYAGMKVQRHFDVVAFRAVWAAFHLTAVLAIGIAAYLWLGLVPAVCVIVVAMAYSALSFYYTITDGTFYGFYGWANPLRYIAPVIVAPALTRVVSRESKPIPFVLLGVVWGLGAWLAQENFTTTIVAAGLTLLLLWITASVSLRTVCRAALYLIVGFACVLTPVLTYYAFHGAAAAFVHAYLAFAGATVAGFANMWWPPQDVVPDRFAYYYTLPFVLALGVCALWTPKPFRLVTPLDRRRALFVALVCVQLACFQTALLRSDVSHVLITLIALPFLLVVGLTDLPQWIAGSGRGRLAVRVAFVIIAVAVYPVLRLRPWGDLVTGPLSKYRSTFVRPPTTYEGRIAYKRATPLLSSEPELASNSQLTMREFLDGATMVHYLAGQRKTYVVTPWFVNTGAFEFFAGLTPAPYPTSIPLNDAMRHEIADHIRAHPGDYECLIAPGLDSMEARAFLDGHPHAVSQTLMIGRHQLDHQIYIVFGNK